jgi:hypothetical protein
MTATLDDVTPRKKRPEPSAEAQAAVELVRLAKEQGLLTVASSHDDGQNSRQSATDAVSVTSCTLTPI